MPSGTGRHIRHVGIIPGLAGAMDDVDHALPANERSWSVVVFERLWRQFAKPCFQSFGGRLAFSCMDEVNVAIHGEGLRALFSRERRGGLGKLPVNPNLLIEYSRSCLVPAGVPKLDNRVATSQVAALGCWWC